jgi:5-methylcytosine-specific restriction endonuclease McrA
MREYARRYYLENRDKVLARAAAYRKLNRDKISEWRKEDRRRNPAKYKEKDRTYYLAHKERILRNTTKYALKHREQVLDTKRRYNTSVKGRRRIKAWHRANKQRPSVKFHRRQQELQRRSLERNNPEAMRQVKAIYAKRWNNCFYCGKRVGRSRVEIEHIRPVALNGKHTCYNLVPACPECNRSKSSRHVNTFTKDQTFLDFI